MINEKRECIFEHEMFTYVCNFETMNMWVVTDQDETSPVTVLEIKRDDKGAWFYRPEGGEEYTRDPDLELCAKINEHYEQFVNRIIVGKNGRVQAHHSERYLVTKG